MTADLRPRFTKSAAAILLVAATTNVAVLQRSTVGVARTFRIVKVLVYNGQAGATTVSFGTGVVGAAAITEILPRMTLQAAAWDGWSEPVLPAFEFEADLVAQATAAGAGALAVRVMVEVEEIGA